MTVFDILEQINVQGGFCIKVWNDAENDYIILASGQDIETEYRNIKENILNCGVKYLYAIDGNLVFELDMENLHR